MAEDFAVDIALDDMAPELSVDEDFAVDIALDDIIADEVEVLVAAVLLPPQAASRASPAAVTATIKPRLLFMVRPFD